MTTNLERALRNLIAIKNAIDCGASFDTSALNESISILMDILKGGDCYDGGRTKSGS